jgi:hypothetical protein
LKVRLALACVGLLIGLFAYVAKAVSGSTTPGSSPFAGLPFGGGANPEAPSLQSPESAAQSAMQALHSQDWRKLYYVCAFEVNEHKTASDAEDFQRELGRAAMINRNPLTIFNLMAAATQFSASNSIVRGTTADVNTSWTIPYEGEVLSLRGVAHMTRVGTVWQLNLIQDGAALDAMLGQVTSRTGHGPAIVIPHFGPFGPHSMPSYAPPPVARTPTFVPPSQQPSVGGGGFNNPRGYQPGVQPGYTPPSYIPGQRYAPGQGTMPAPPFGPGQMPGGSRFGPSTFPRGPRFGPSGMPGGGGFSNSPGYQPGGGMSPPPGGGGFGSTGGTFGSPVGGAPTNQQPEGSGQASSDSSGPPQ